MHLTKNDCRGSEFVLCGSDDCQIRKNRLGRQTQADTKDVPPSGMRRETKPTFCRVKRKTSEKIVCDVLAGFLMASKTARSRHWWDLVPPCMH